MRFSILFQAAVGLFTLASGAVIVRPDNTNEGRDILRPSAGKRETDKTSLATPGPPHVTSILDFVPQTEAALFPPDEFDIQSRTNNLTTDDERLMLDILGETEANLLATLKQVTGNKGPAALGELDSLAKLKVETARAPVDLLLKKLSSRFPSFSKFREWAERRAAGQPSGFPEIDALVGDVRHFIAAQSGWEFVDELIQAIHPGSSGLEAREVDLDRRHPVALGLAWLGGAIFGACYDGDCLNG